MEEAVMELTDTLTTPGEGTVETEKKSVKLQGLFFLFLTQCDFKGDGTAR